MVKLIKRYRFFLFTLLVLAVLYVFSVELGKKATRTITSSLKEMAFVMPPLFILLGLLDVWVSKETMIKYMGAGSGLKGTILSFALGSVGAGPLYAAFPVASVLVKKGVRFDNILIFIGAWSTMKIPMLLLETNSFGKTFTFIRFIINVPGILIMAYLLNKFIVSKEKERIYERMKLME